MVIVFKRLLYIITDYNWLQFIQKTLLINYNRLKLIIISYFVRISIELETGIKIIDFNCIKNRWINNRL